MKIFQRRQIGGHIPIGVSWQWTGGPIMFYMSKNRVWRFKIRFRIANHYPGTPWKWNPGLFISKVYHNGTGGIDVYGWHFEINSTNPRGFWRKGPRPTS